MKLYEVHYASNCGGVVIKEFKAKDETGVLKKAQRYCDNAILRIEHVHNL